MLTIFFVVLFLSVFVRLTIVAVKAAWTIAKVVVYILLLPVCLIVLALSGFLFIAIPILIVIGIVEIIKALKKNRLKQEAD